MSRIARTKPLKEESISACLSESPAAGYECKSDVETSEEF